MAKEEAELKSDKEVIDYFLDLAGITEEDKLQILLEEYPELIMDVNYSEADLTVEYGE